MPEWLEILIEGGSVGICVTLIFYMWKKDKMVNKTLNNHLDHTYRAQKADTKAKIKLAKALTEFKDIIGVLTNKIK